MALYDNERSSLDAAQLKVSSAFQTFDNTRPLEPSGRWGRWPRRLHHVVDFRPHFPNDSDAAASQRDEGKENEELG